MEQPFFKFNLKTPPYLDFIENSADYYYAVDANWRLTYVNVKTSQYYNMTKEELIGKELWSLVPGGETTEVYREHQRAMNQRTHARFEVFFNHVPSWAEYDLYPLSDGGLMGCMRDITRHKMSEGFIGNLDNINGSIYRTIAVREYELKRSFMLKLTDILEEQNDTDGIQLEAASLLGKYLGVDRAFYALIHRESGTASIQCDYYRDGLDSIAGSYPTDNFAGLVEALDAKQHFFISDTKNSPILSADIRSFCNDQEIRSFVAILLAQDSKYALNLFIVSHSIREWSPVEINLILEVGQRSLDSVKRVLAEERLRESEQRYRAYVMAGTEVIFQMSPDWSKMIMLQAKGFPKIKDTPKSDWLHNYIHPDDHEKILNAINDSIRSQNALEMEHRVLNSDDAFRWLYTCVVPVFNTKGEIIEWFGASKDITEEKQHEVNKAFLAGITGDISSLSSADMIMQTAGSKISGHMGVSSCLLAEIDKDGITACIEYGWFDEGTPRITGKLQITDFISEDLFQATLGGKTLVIENTQTDHRINAEWCKAMDVAASIGVPFHQNGRLKYIFLINASTPRYWTAGEQELIKDAANRIFPCMVRAQAVEALRMSKQQMRLAMESAQMVLWGRDLVTGERWFSEDADRLFGDFGLQNAAVNRGLSIQEIIDKCVLPEDADRYSKAIEEMERSGMDMHLEYRLVHPETGRVCWIETHASCIYANDTTPVYIVGIAKNITERKEAEERLRESEEKYRTLFSSMEEGFEIVEVIFDENMGPVDFRILEVNPVHEKLTGLRDVVGKRLSEAVEEISDVSRTCIQNFGMVALTGQPVSFVIESKQVGRWFSVYACRIDTCSTGSNTNVAVFFKDITKEVREKNELERNLKIQDEIFSNVSHELKTPLNMIFSTNQVIEFYLKNDLYEENRESILKNLRIIKQNCYRCTKLINNIVDLSKIDSGYFEINLVNENVVEIVENIVQSVADFVKNKGMGIIFDTDTEEKIMALDPVKMERIILNLISNAIKFSNPGDYIYVNIRDMGESVEISVRDTGVGIKAEHLDSIFKRYHQVDKTLTRNAEGSGIGLSLIKSIIDLLGGEISVESEVGKGSTFTIVLPAQIVEAPEDTAKPKMSRNKVETIDVEFSDIYSVQ
jgi:PAS domain S-box-containing protein